LPEWRSVEENPEGGVGFLHPIPLGEGGGKAVKPSMWTSAYHELEPEEAVERLFEVGWRWLEFSYEHWRKLAERRRPTTHFRKLGRFFERLGVKVPQMHGPMFNVCDPDRKKVKENVKLTKQVLKWARELGVRWVVLHPGSAPMAEDEKALEEVRRAHLRWLGEIVETAKEAGVGIAIENACDGDGQGRRVFGSIPSELLWLVRNLDPERVGICWDTGHAHLQRLDQRRAIKALGKHLVATHIDDNHQNTDEHLLPFDGTVDWKSVLSGLKEARYSGLFNMEVGGAMAKVPLTVRDEKLRYALELCKAFVEGRVP